MLSMHRCYYYTGVVTVQVLLLYMCCYCTCVATVQVLLLLYRCYYCTSLVTVQVLLLYICCYCTGVVTVHLLLLYRCCYCTGVATVQVLLLYSVQCTMCNVQCTLHIKLTGKVATECHDNCIMFDRATRCYKVHNSLLLFNLNQKSFTSKF